MNRVLSISIKTFLILIGIVVVLCFISIGTLVYLNSTNQLNDIACKFLNRNIAGFMYFEDLKLNFDKFPVVRLTANNGYMISHLHHYPTDTLARFRHLDVQMDVSRLLDDSLTVYIPQVDVTDGYALVTIGKDGVPGWNVWRFKKPKPNNGSRYPHREKLYIKHVRLYGENRFQYYNFRRNRSMDIRGENVNFDGEIRIKYREIYVSHFSANQASVDIRLNNGKTRIMANAPTINIFSKIIGTTRYYNLNVATYNTLLDFKGKMLFQGLDSVGLNINVGTDFNNNNYYCRNMNLALNNILKIHAQGDVKLNEKKIDMHVEIESPNVRNFVEKYHNILKVGIKLPWFRLPTRATFDIKGRFSLKPFEYPIINATFHSSEGEISTKYGSILNIIFFARSDFDYNKLDKAYITFDTIHFDWRHSSVGLSGKFAMIKSRPHISARFNTSISMADFRDIVNLQMNVTGDMKSRGLITTTFNNDYKVKFFDALQLSKIRFRIPHTMAFVSIPHASLSLNEISSNKNLYAKLGIPYTIINSKKDAQIYLRKFNLSTSISNYIVGNMPEFDNSHLSIGPSSMITYANDTLRMKNMDMHFKVSDMSDFRPVVKYFAILENLSLSNPDSLLMSVRDLSVTSEASLYSWVNVTPQSIFKLWDVIGNWKYSGVLNIENSHFTMPQLPLYNRVDSMLLTFTQSDASIEKLNASFGNTKVQAKLKVKNWHNYIFSDSVLQATGDIYAQDINMNQLIPAVVSGVAFNNSKKSIRLVDSVEIRSITKFAMVPSNLNVSLNLHAHNANYGLGYMQNATAAINVTPKSVAFNDVKFRSNLADVDMDFVYHTPDSTHAEVTL